MLYNPWMGLFLRFHHQLPFTTNIPLIAALNIVITYMLVEWCRNDVFNSKRLKNIALEWRRETLLYWDICRDNFFNCFHGWESFIDDNEGKTKVMKGKVTFLAGVPNSKFETNSYRKKISQNTSYPCKINNMCIKWTEFLQLNHAVSPVALVN